MSVLDLGRSSIVETDPGFDECAYSSWVSMCFAFELVQRNTFWLLLDCWGFSWEGVSEDEEEEEEEEEEDSHVPFPGSGLLQRPLDLCLSLL